MSFESGNCGLSYTFDQIGLIARTVEDLVAWFAPIYSHDLRESGDSRESEIRVIRAKRPDALQK